ncbi:cation:proton antiporter [Amycolatopsis sp. NPDC088138]|uniref:cation:proton antiporter n=1 Tax=Amycolatopsis sp. NPDC088138 TaxID=3363938 RepID=UPI003824136D
MSTEHLAISVLLAVGVIIAVATAVRPLCERIRQPAVMGQMAAGLVLGVLPAQLTGVIFPKEILPFLNVISQLGLVLFLFAIGYELDLRVLRGRLRSTLLVAVGALVVPLLLGAGLGKLLFGTELSTPSGSAVTPATFILFTACALSITAVPVLCWILRERGLIGTVAGIVALAAASIIDIAGWSLLAVPLASVHGGSVGTMFFFLAAYLAVMWWIVRPALRRWMRSSNSRRIRVPVLTALAIGSAYCTAKMGLHFIFGALFMGLITPREEDGAHDPELLGSVESESSALLPVFFVVTGLSVDIGGLSRGTWALLVLICALAIAGKIGGGTIAARLAGMPTRAALSVGVLLNTRGLTELIALNAGWEAKIIGREFYTVLVIMAVFTTAMTGPLITLLQRPKRSADTSRKRGPSRARNGP